MPQQQVPTTEENPNVLLLSRYKDFAPENSPVVKSLDDGRAVLKGEIQAVQKGIFTMKGEVVLPDNADFEQIKAFVESVKKNENFSDYLLKYLISIPALDRRNDGVDQSGWQLQNFKKNNVVYLEHNTWSLPIGNGFNLAVTQQGLEGQTRFHGLTDTSKVIALLCMAGVMKAVSAGFIPLEWQDLPMTTENRALYGAKYNYPDKIRLYKKQELFEYSHCGIPANPGTVGGTTERKSFEQGLQMAVQAGFISADSPEINMLAGTQKIVLNGFALQDLPIVGQSATTPETPTAEGGTTDATTENPATVENSTTPETPAAPTAPANAADQTTPTVQKTAEDIPTVDKGGAVIRAALLNILKSARDGLNAVIAEAEKVNDSDDDTEEKTLKILTLSQFTVSQNLVLNELAEMKSQIAALSAGNTTEQVPPVKKTLNLGDFKRV